MTIYIYRDFLDSEALKKCEIYMDLEQVNFWTKTSFQLNFFSVL